MVKKIHFLAVVICSMLLFPPNANANWLAIIKGIAGGVIGISQQPAKAQASAAPAAQTKPEPVAQPTEQELLAAFDSLSRNCERLSKQGFPCGIGTGKSPNSPGNAEEIASARADGALAKSVKQFVSIKATDILESLEDDDDIKESMEYKRTLDVAAEQEISGAQTYLTYTQKTKKGSKDVYEVWVVRVLDKSLFERALAEISQGKPLSRQIIAETAKGFASKIKDLFRNKK